MRLSTAARNAQVAAVTALIDAGTGPGVLQLRDGTAPAGPGSTATGTLLASFTLADPAFAAPTGGTGTADVDPALTATAADTGTPTWYRILDSAGTPLADGDVATDMTITPSAVTVGATVTLTAWTLTAPAA